MFPHLLRNPDVKCSRCLSPGQRTRERGTGTLYERGRLVPNVCAQWVCENGHEWWQLLEVVR